MQLIPNLLGMFVYADEACPRFDPPATFHRWAAARSPRQWRYQPDEHDVCVRLR